MTKIFIGFGMVVLVMLAIPVLLAWISSRRRLHVARRDGARTLVVTAQPSGPCPAAADLVLAVPAQTMADDRGASTSVLPMGSLYEGALYVLFEIMIVKLRERLGVSAGAMRANHTNLE